MTTTKNVIIAVLIVLVVLVFFNDNNLMQEINSNYCKEQNIGKLKEYYEQLTNKTNTTEIMNDEYNYIDDSQNFEIDPCKNFTVFEYKPISNETYHKILHVFTPKTATKFIKELLLKTSEKSLEQVCDVYNIHKFYYKGTIKQRKTVEAMENAAAIIFPNLTCDFISGNTDITFENFLPFQYDTLLMLRNPTDRFLSRVLENPQHLTIDDCLKNQCPKFFEETETRFLDRFIFPKIYAQKYPLEEYERITALGRVDSAKEVLCKSTFGIFEQFEEGIEYIKWKLHLSKDFPLDPIGENPDFPQVQKSEYFNETVITILNNLLYREHEIYEFGKQVFNYRYNQYLQTKKSDTIEEEEEEEE